MANNRECLANINQPVINRLQNRINLIEYKKNEIINSDMDKRGKHGVIGKLNKEIERKKNAINYLITNKKEKTNYKKIGIMFNTSL